MAHNEGKKLIDDLLDDLLEEMDANYVGGADKFIEDFGAVVDDFVEKVDGKYRLERTLQTLFKKGPQNGEII